LHLGRVNLVTWKTNQNLIRTFVYILFLLNSGPLYAQVVPVPAWEEEDEEAERSWEQVFIEDNVRFSRWFDSVAEGLDLFLVGKKVTEKRNESSVRIENSTFSKEGEKVSNSTALSINPRFPNFEEYWQLKFTTYDEREDSRNAQSTYLRQIPRERNVGASVGFFNKLGSIRTAFQPRVELQNPLKISHSLSFETVADYKSWQINPRIEFYANPAKGVGIFTALNFNFYLTTKFTFTLINQGDYIEKQNRFEATNGFSLGQVLTRRISLGYGILAFTNNRPGTHLEGYSASVTFSHLIYRRILDYQLIPHLDFERIKKFKGQAGITLNINLNF